MADTFRPDLLAGKVAFVAGASSGINLRIAERFAAAGAKVAILSRSEEKISAAAAVIQSQGGDALGLAADVRDYDAVAAALQQAREHFGELDIVLSGAAGNFVAPALGMSANGFRTVVDSLISITAPQAVKPQVYQSHVCAAKAGVNMLTQCLAMEWGPAGVRVNAVSPGPIGDTEGMARLAPTPEIAARYKAQLALRGYGAKDDIADTCLFLCSDAACYITGAIIDCDGGTSLGDASLDALSPLK
jgi:NAD(P)-dependent dehydrogenase (short-subunit alcohol dehydrogenase family)